MHPASPTVAPSPANGRIWPRSCADASSGAVRFWLLLSLALAVAYAVPSYQVIFDADYAVQDDARQHVFWMARFQDPGAFPNDPIADYFQSVAPPGFAALYRLAALVGIAPLDLHRVLPILLALATSWLCFRVVLLMLPLPVAAFLATALLSQNHWLKDDVISATPRAFAYPLFAAFLYLLLRRSPIPVLVTVVLLGLFYPQVVTLCLAMAVLQLVRWKGWRPDLIRERSARVLCLATLAVSLLVLVPHALFGSPFGPQVGAAEARQMPEFLSDGRTEFFVTDALDFWLYGERSGFLPFEWGRAPLWPPQFFLAFLLPPLLVFRSRFPLVRQLSPAAASAIPQLLLSGLGMFLAAHQLLFTLHLPARYSQFSLRFALAMAAGLALAIAIDGVYRWARQPGGQAGELARSIVRLGALGLGAWVLLYPLLLELDGGVYPYTNYRHGTLPSLYQFFARQPAGSLIASLDAEANNIPSFARRSILVGREYAIPFHLGYYLPFRQRTLDLIQAQYSSDPQALRTPIERYGIDFLLLDRDALTPDYLAANDWVMQFESTTRALSNLRRGEVPALTGLIEPCTVFETRRLVVLDGECLVKAIDSPSGQ